MINSVFGFGLLKDYDVETDSDVMKPCLYVSNADVWEKGYCSDCTGTKEYEVLGDLKFNEECDGIFTQQEKRYNGLTMVDVKQLPEEEIKKKLIEAGFVYNEKFEEFMRDGEEEE